MKSFCKTSMHCFKTYVKTFVLNSHEYTVHLIAALQCRPTKANKGSMLIYSDIYFNIDSVVSSRPFFSHQAKPKKPWAECQKWKVHWSEWACIYDLFQHGVSSKRHVHLHQKQASTTTWSFPGWMWTSLTLAAVSALCGSCMFMIDCHLVWEICKWLADSQVCLANMYGFWNSRRTGIAHLSLL